METIHIYAINLNPSGPDRNTSAQKSAIVDSVFSHYQEKHQAPCEMGKVIMFSFRPMDNRGYTAFIEEYVHKKTAKPCILVFKSLMDLANVPKTACSRLQNLIHQDGVRAVYFSDYSTDRTADTYFNWLLRIFNIDIGTDLSVSAHRKSLYPEALKKEIRRLRLLMYPVLYTDISKVTGISESTLRSMVNPPNTQGSRGPNGRPITEEETATLTAIMKHTEQSIFRSIEIFEESYIR